MHMLCRTILQLVKGVMTLKLFHFGLANSCFEALRKLCINGEAV